MACDMTEAVARSIIDKIKGILLACGAHFTVSEVYRDGIKFLTITDVSIKIK